MTRAPAPAGYECLAEVLDCALMQAASGKGNERHANGKPFIEQPMIQIAKMVGVGSPVGQVMKKAQEAVGMSERGQTVAAINELLGVINYAAGAILTLKARSATERAATAPQAAPTLNDSHQPVPGLCGAWERNSYTDLRDSIVGPVTDDGSLFPSGWTPETDTAETKEG